jgi:hypothetical protein
LAEKTVRPFVELKRFIEFSEPDSARAVRGAKLEVSRKHRRKKTTIMPLLHILLALIIVGFFLWLVNRFIPMAGSIKSILNGVVAVGVFGIFHSLSGIRVG